MSKSETDELIARLKSFTVPEDNSDRRRLWEASRSFSATVEDEVTFQHKLLSSPLLLVIPKIASDLGVFDVLLKSEKPVSTEDVAIKTKADSVLLGRILRYLSSQYMISSPSPHHWAPSPSTPFLANPAYAAGLRFGNLCVLPSCQAFPNLLSSQSYSDTTSVGNSAFQLAHSTSKSMFEWLSSRPDDRGDFQKWMAETHKRDKSPFDVLPLAQLTQNTSPDLAVFVDVGGGNGSSCMEFKQRIPNLKGRIINQDIQATDQGAQIEGVEHSTHDFFTEQPIKGARIYHVRKVLRSWSDEQCVKILQHLREAMDENSVILVDDIAIDATKLDWHACYVDLMMGMFFGMRERNVSEFESIFDQAGLTVKDVKQYMEGSGEHYMLLGLKE